MRRWTFALVVAALVAAPPIPARAAPAAGAPPTVLPAGRTYQVTLLTGEVATVRSASRGCPIVSVRPAYRGEAIAKTCDPRGHVHVVPVRAGRLRDRIDPALFDVTTLIQQGYDDAHSASLPLIVQYAKGRTGSAFTAGMPARRNLASLRGVAVAEPKRRAGSLAGALMSTMDGSPDVAHVWLDRKIQVAGPPDTPVLSAAGAGVTTRSGPGVAVAVLDTGIDATHPDLAGAVIASQDFVDDTGSVVDRVGHGTHVAGIIAGTGTASGGRYAGVAPGTKLVIGKVLDDSGAGEESGVIAGMEWAAPQVKVVSMSLGGDPSDGTDVLSEAADALTAQYGTLFVAAAGNSGPDAATVGGPGAGASVLTVGAVDATGTVADFSSRGPLAGRVAMKPEITAPGVGIVSARAAGTDIGTVVDRFYTSLDGTSMATPAVAAAAAVVARARPGWGPAQVKAALVGAADPARGDPYAAGAGQVNLARALAVGPVAATATADLGTLAASRSGPVSAPVRWSDPGTTPTTLDLSLSMTQAGHRVPAGAVTLSADKVTVPAGGTAGVTLTVDESRLATHPGQYSGILTATDGTHRIRTPVAFVVQPPTVNLTLRESLLPDAAPDSAFVIAQIVDLDESELFSQEFVGDATGPDGFTMAVPAGRYSVTGVYLDTSNGGLDRAAIVGTAEVGVTADTSVTFDAARARAAVATVPDVATEVQHAEVNLIQTARESSLWWTAAAAFGPETGGPQVFSTPIADVDVGSLHASEAFGLRAPGTGASPFEYSLGRFLPHGVPADPAWSLSAKERRGLARIDETFDLPSVPGTGRFHQRYLVSPEGVLVGEDISDTVGPTRTDYVSPGSPWSDEAATTGDVPLAGALLEQERAEVYQPGSRTAKTWFGGPLHPDWTDTPIDVGCRRQPIERTRGNLHVEIASDVDAPGRTNCLDLPFGGAARTVTLYDGATELGSHQFGLGESTAADLPIPGVPGTYRLRYTEDFHGAYPRSDRTTTDWTFRSGPPAHDGPVAVPLLAVEYAFLGHGPADFTVRQVHGQPTQTIASFTVAVSMDGGQNWSAVPATRTGPGAFSATLPASPTGQPVSLRVSSSASGGSAITQTLIDAYV